MKGPRTLTIRRWLALALLALFMAPLMTMVVLGAILFGDTNGPVEADREVIAEIRANPAQWDDPAWQQALMTDYARDRVDVVLTRDGEVVFQSTDDPVGNDVRQVQRVTIPETEPPQVALVYSDEQQGPPTEFRQWFVPAALIVALLLVLAGIAWFLRRWMIEPLTATSEAAQRIAQGELDISLPSSRVREVDRLGRAFEAMSADLQRSLGQQAQLEEERRQFIGAIAHDLRTPLFSLRGSLEGIATGVAKTPEQQRRYLEIAQAKADQLERLIADLFTFTRLEFLEERPHLTEVDLRVLGREVMTSAVPRAGSRRLEVVDEPGDTDTVIRADPHMLTRALDNLLDNALRHTPDGGLIRMAIEVRRTSVVLALTDSGPGFATSDLPHLFEPLYRGEASRNRETGGAGLGLTVARRIVEVHGGTLTAANAPDGGATVTMTMPLARSSKRSDQPRRA